jgi:hypothetical protein
VGHAFTSALVELLGTRRRVLRGSQIVTGESPMQEIEEIKIWNKYYNWPLSASLHWPPAA